ncbi:MAG: acetylglutamate kinase, partial [Dehalococcoidia bacterium]|nr:acetylglutamate kinase [Dehalococcoidia bacterium]
MNAPQKLVVIKLGGSVIDSKDATVLDVLELTHTGWRVVVVHGGGKLVTQWMGAQGVKSEFHQGERITDRNSLDVVT